MTAKRISAVSFPKLVVRDLDAMAAFYRSVCGYGEGYRLEDAIAGSPIAEIIFNKPEGGAELVLLTFTEGPLPSPSGVMIAYDTDDLDAFQARVLVEGGSVVEAIKPLEFNGNRMRMGIFADIEGYMLEVLER
jgi:predicted enzyme related to lactoylglutathione lyase